MQNFFSKDEIATLSKGPIPRHVAIIMDGNRRWAKKHLIAALTGHWEGAKVLINTILAAKELGVSVLTVFGFSTENWKRTKKEVDLLIHIYEKTLQDNRKMMVDEGIRFSTIGDLEPFPHSLKEEIAKTKDATNSGKSIDFVAALNYGGRDELKRAMQKIINEQISASDITEEVITSRLDTGLFVDPDLLIRTSGEMRLSNFLLWQLAYTEIVVTDVLWPDFSPRDLLQHLRTFQQRERREGR